MKLCAAIIFMALGFFGHFDHNASGLKMEINQHFNGALVNCLKQTHIKENDHRWYGQFMQRTITAIGNFFSMLTQKTKKEEQAIEIDEELKKEWEAHAQQEPFARKFVHCLKELFDNLIAHHGEQEAEGNQNVVKNWMNSFLNAKMKYGEEAANGGKEFSVVFDSVNNLPNMPGNFLLGSCPEHKIKNAQNKEVYASCKRHKMQIYTPPKSSHAEQFCSEKFVQKIYDGTELEMRICHDKMMYHELVAIDAYFIVIDGDRFRMFDPMLDSGALGAPQMDGIFSLAFSSKHLGKMNNKDKLKSGVEFLLGHSSTSKKAHNIPKVATVFMQSFHHLDFFSPTKGAITIGENDRIWNCADKWEHLDIVDQPDSRWHIPMSASTEWPEGHEKNNLEMVDQKAMISTTDIFIFAPKEFTDPLMEMVESVNDNLLFKFGRALGKFGLVPKDVLIKCPEEEDYEKMPTVKIQFGALVLTLTPKEYIMPIVLPKLPVVGNLGVFNWCHNMIRPKPSSGMFAKDILPKDNKNTWMFGQLLFNKACVKFDYDKRQIGLANADQKN